MMVLQDNEDKKKIQRQSGLFEYQDENKARVASRQEQAGGLNKNKAASQDGIKTRTRRRRTRQAAVGNQLVSGPFSFDSVLQPSGSSILPTTCLSG